jgi:hypothetical protein
MNAETELTMESEDLTALLDHLEATGVSRGQAARLVDEVLAHFSETSEEFVRRRHRELQADGVANAVSFAAIAGELAQRRVAGPRLSERQIRRVIYG